MSGGRTTTAITFLVASAVILAAASSASAASFHSSTEETKFLVSALTTPVFTSTAGEVTCKEADAEGAVIGEATFTAIKLTPKYDDCHIIIFGATIEANVNMRSCYYRITASGELHIECSKVGDTIEITAAGCTIKLPAQTASSLSYTNVENHIEIGSSVTGLDYTHTGFSCGTGSGGNGQYKGTAYMEGQLLTIPGSAKIWWT